MGDVDLIASADSPFPPWVRNAVRALRAERDEALLLLQSGKALHRGTHQCVGGRYYTDDSTYRGSIATVGPCPTLAALASVGRTEPAPEADEPPGYSAGIAELGYDGDG